MCTRGTRLPRRGHRAPASSPCPAEDADTRLNPYDAEHDRLCVTASIKDGAAAAGYQGSMKVPGATGRIRVALAADL